MWSCKDFICRYTVPKELKTMKLVGAAVDKAVILQAVLEDLKSKKIIIFTGSLPATHRSASAS